MLDKLGVEHVTVADVKAAFSQQLMISPRKAITIRWLGAELNDSSTLSDLRVPEGALFEAAFRQRKPAELEPFQNVQHVIVHIEFPETESRIVDVPASSSTLVSELKVLCKPPSSCQISFSAYNTSAFGIPLDDERTLGSYGVLDGDLLFCTPGSGPTSDADVAKPPPAKKK